MIPTNLIGFHTSHSSQDTILLAHRLALALQPGDAVALVGMLGAGKTEFVRGIVEGLGVEAEVSSPSFVRVHAYGGDPQVFHADFYLAKSEADALDDGLDELVTAGGIVLVEWADRFPHLIPPGSWWISIEWPGGEEDMRKIRIEKR